MDLPPEAGALAERWNHLSRWERAELSRDLRRLGWFYGEIIALIPVGKGTLSGWCREIRLTQDQIKAIKARVPSQKGVPKDTNWKRREEVQIIRDLARDEARERMTEPFWVAGTVLYWGEGDKSSRRLSLVNSDPRALALFTAWTRAYHDQRASFVLALHLHHGNDDAAAQAWWRQQLQAPDATFHKTFIKPPGTGHRKNHLVHGVCRVMMRRSGNAWHRTMAWIDVLALEYANPTIDRLGTGSLAQLAEQETLNLKVAGSSPARPTQQLSDNCGRSRIGTGARLRIWWVRPMWVRVPPPAPSQKPRSALSFWLSASPLLGESRFGSCSN